MLKEEPNSRFTFQEIMNKYKIYMDNLSKNENK